MIWFHCHLPTYLGTPYRFENRGFCFSMNSHDLLNLLLPLALSYFHTILSFSFYVTHPHSHAAQCTWDQDCKPLFVMNFGTKKLSLCESTAITGCSYILSLCIYPADWDQYERAFIAPFWRVMFATHGIYSITSLHSITYLLLLAANCSVTRKNCQMSIKVAQKWFH